LGETTISLVLRPAFPTDPQHQTGIDAPLHAFLLVNQAGSAPFTYDAGPEDNGGVISQAMGGLVAGALGQNYAATDMLVEKLGGRSGYDGPAIDSSNLRWILASGDDLSGIIDRLNTAAGLISGKFPYGTPYPNSNSFVASLMSYAGLQVPGNAAGILRLAPGFDESDLVSRVVAGNKVNNQSIVEQFGDAAVQFFWSAEDQTYHIGGLPQCFPAGTGIRLASGDEVKIEDVEIGALVASFSSASPFGPTVPKRVTRTFRSVTDAWIILSNGLIVTPGHHFLAPSGDFRTIADILANDGMIVLESGRQLKVSGQYVSYSTSTAGQFEQAEVYMNLSFGAHALAPELRRGWRTYNFEVEELHTYVAGGVRVHNQSVIIGSGADKPVGPAVGPNGEHLWVNADGTVTNLDTGYIAPGPAGYTSSNPENPNDNLKKTWEGTGPALELASGTATHVGTVFKPGNGYLYVVNSDGSVTNTQTGHTSAPAAPQIPAPLPGHELPANATVVQRYEAAGYSPSQAYAAASQTAAQQAANPNNNPSTTANSANPVAHDYAPAGAATTGGIHDAGGSGGLAGGVPVVLDLDGNGVKITPLSSSYYFNDVVGDGEKHRTAWAGAGDGVLVIDPTNSGVISQRNQIDFTSWDPTAKTDMEALKDVFDTNHDGSLDSGDADWSQFKVMVTNADGTTTLETLSALGITSINLTTNNEEIDFSDGSKITGTTTFTKSNGSTGMAADAELSYDPNGFVVAQTVTHNGDGSTTVDTKANNTDGSLANETVATTSADGNTRTTTYDDDGDGVVDQRQSDVTVHNGDGSVTETLSTYNSSGTILTSKQVTTISADGKTTTVSRDFSGSGSYDQVETDVWGTGGDLTVTVTNLNRDGSTHDKTITTSDASALSKTIQRQLTGSGAINATETDTITVDGSGNRTEVVNHYAGSGTTSSNLVEQVTTVTSADGSTRSIASDLDGNGTIDLTVSSTITHNLDGSTTTVQSETNGNSSLREKTTTQLSADGNTKTTQVDLNGDGTTDATTIDGIVHNVDGSTTETVTQKSGNGTVLSVTSQTWSADGTTCTINTDRDGDGHNDHVETVAIVSGSSVDTVSTYSPNGATLLSKTVTTTSSDGLTTTTQSDLNGDGTYDAVETNTTVINVDHSSTVTDIVTNGAGTVQVGKTVTNTSADGLSITVQKYLDAQTSPYSKVTDAKVLNGDSSTTETVTTYAGTSSVQVDKVVTTVSADKLTTTIKDYLDSNSSAWMIETKVTNTDGSQTDTVSGYSPNGATLLDKDTTTVSADGLTVTSSTDGNGDGVVDATASSVITLNSDGSTTKTTKTFAGSVVGPTNRTSKTVVTTSGNGLSVTTQTDADGNGTYESEVTDVTVLNSDGSKTETVTDFNGDGTVQIGKVVTTTSGNGLSKTVSTYLDADTTADHVTTDVVTLNADGSTVETVTDKSADGNIRAKTVTTTSGSGLSTTVATDLDGNGVNDIVTARTVNSDGSVTTVTSVYNASGTLTSKTTETVSGNGLSKTMATDLDGNGTTDQSKSDTIVLNSDGSKTETVSDFTGTSTLKDKTVIATSADGLSVTTQWDNTGSGTFSDSRTDVKTVNADGSTTEVVSDFNANGSLHDKTTTTVSADGTTTSVASDSNGDGTAEHNWVTTKNADGSVTKFAYEGALHNSAGRIWGDVKNRYEWDSADGLTKTIQYDSNGDGLANSQTVDVTVLNTDGSRVETITDANLSGGDPNSANPIYTVTVTDHIQTTTSGNGLVKTTAWDLTGSGIYTESSVDATTLNADGSKTDVVSFFTGTTLNSRTTTSTSADGLTVTEALDPTGAGSATQYETTATTLNADGSTTKTTTDIRTGGGLIAKTVVTTSADGRTIATQQDPNGTGSFTQSKTDTTLKLADGSTSETISDFNAGGSLKDKTTIVANADSSLVTISRDANGDGHSDQTEVITNFVDGSSSNVTSDLNSSGTILDQTTSTTSADGRVTQVSHDFNHNGIVDQTETDTLTHWANGGTQEVVQSYKTSHTVGGVESAITPVLQRTVTVVNGADGRHKSTNIDVDGNGTTDTAISTVTMADGSLVTTMTDDAAAKAIAPAAGAVLWSSAVTTSNKTVASASTTTISADGLHKTVQADYDGNGTYEHTESWQQLVDGSEVGYIQDVNASGAIVARGIETISADGLTTTLLEDKTGNGQINHEDVSVTHIDGSKTETVTDLTSTGTLLQTVVTNVVADGQSASAVVTPGPTTQTTVSASNVTPNYFGTSETVNITGNNDIVSLGGAVDAVAISGSNDTVNETGNAFVTVTGAGTGKRLQIFGTNNVGSISSSGVYLEDDASLILTGSNDAIVAYDATDLQVWSGTGNTLEVAVNSHATATISSSSLVLLDNDSSLNLTGNSNHIAIYDDTSLIVASGTGNNLEVGGTGAAATISSSAIGMDDNSSLTLVGVGDTITMYDHTSLDATGSTGDTINVHGVSGFAQVSGATINIAAADDISIEGSGNTVTVAGNGSFAATRSSNNVTVNGVGVYLAVDSSIISVSAGDEAHNNGSNDTVNLANGSSIEFTGGTGNTINASGASGYADVNGAILNIATGDYFYLDGTGNVVNLGQGSSVSTGGTGDTINVNGTSTYASIGSATINVAAGDDIDVDGSGNTVALANNASFSSSSGTGNTVNVNGTGIYLAVASSTINVNAGGEAHNNGSNNTVHLGAGASIEFTGGTGNTVDVGAVSAYADIASGTINLADSDFYLDGNGNLVNMGSGSSVTTTGYNDTFVFQPSFGHETIDGYVASGTNVDEIDVSHTVFADWAHLLAASTQSGSDVIITADANDTITLKNTTLASLQSSHFHFT